MQLLDLPNEVLGEICGWLTCVADISCWTRTCQRLFHLSIAQLYKYDLLHKGSVAIPYALEHDAAGTLQRVLDCGLDVVMSHHFTLAAVYERRDFLLTLWKFKATFGGFGNLNEDERDEFPFLSVVARSWTDVAQLFLATGTINMKLQNDIGDTALQIAAKHGTPEMVRLLLEYNANMLWTDEDGRQPLALAVRSYDCEYLPGDGDCLGTISMLLANGAEVDHRDSSGTTAFHYAVWHGNVEAAQLLASHGADYNSRDSQNKTPLHTCLIILFRGFEMIQMLVQLGADPNAVDNNGRNSLFFEPFPKQPAEVAEFLLRSGAQMLTDSEGESPLQNSTRLGSPELVEVFIKHGAEVNGVNTHGETPLHTACSGPWSEVPVAQVLLVVQVLLEHGADVKARTLQGKTALELAALRYSVEDIQDQLWSEAFDGTVRVGGETVPISKDVTYKCLTDVVALLLQHGAEVDSANMHTAARHGDIKMLELFAEHGGSLEAVDAHGTTVYETAVRAGRRELVDWLINKGVSKHRSTAPRQPKGSTTTNDE